MPYLGIILELEFENNIVIFEITALEYVELQNFVKERKCLNLEPNLGTLGLEF